jgi:8-oxo-dGTP pyrophosphatase MutT (NUDIX family)
MPGGLVDADEEPAAAARELEEVTEYRAGQVEHVATLWWRCRRSS